MKRFLTVFCAAALVLGCTKELTSRVDQLESDVMALQQGEADLKERLADLEDNVYVTGVTEIIENGEVIGYTITLSKGPAITIYHGEDGADGKSPEVEVSESEVTFRFSDGTVVTIPRTSGFSLNISSASVAILPGATVEIAYSISGATGSTVVYAVADGGYSAEVKPEGISEGKIAVTAPDPATDGKVVVFAGDNTQAAMQVLSFEEGLLTLAGDIIEVGKEGASVEVAVTTNLEYEISIPEDASWISYVETKAVRNETVVLNVAANDGVERSATVSFTVNGVSVQDVTILQQTAEEPKFTLEDLIGDWTVSYGTSGSTYTWKFMESDDESKGNVRLDNIFGKSGIPVYATFNLYTGELYIPLRQQCKDDYGYSAWLCTYEETSSVSYTVNEDGTFGNPTATIAYAFYEGSSASKSLANVSGVKVDPNTLAIGNYYYSDGTCTSIWHSDKTLVGVVAWLGDLTATDPTLKAAYPDCTNGLVVAVDQVDNIKWQSNAASITDWQAANLTGYTTLYAAYSAGADNLDNCLGYNNTQVIKAYNEANPDNAAEIYDALLTFAGETPAPEGTSGWYIPSAKEVSYIVVGNNSNAFYASGTNNLSALNEKITAAGLSKITYTYLASSTEISETNVYAQQGTYLFNPKKEYAFTLCPVFAF